MSTTPDGPSQTRPSRTGTPRAPREVPLSQQVARALGIIVSLIILALIARYCRGEQDIHFRVQDRVAPIDGDTLKSGTTEIRLYGIDAPELAQPCTDANGKEWACGRSAQTRLKALIGRKAVDCAPRDKDKFNRVVAICRTSSVPDLGEALVREGLAVNFGAAGKEGPYSSAEADAKSAKRGVWQGAFDLPSNWRDAHPRQQN
jgi:endonuclease YncB( thermonuclease family)